MEIPGDFACHRFRPLVSLSVSCQGIARSSHTSINVDSLSVGGEFSVSEGNVAVDQFLDWRGGTMSGSGETIVGSLAGEIDGSLAKLEIHGGRLDGRTLTNRGEATWNDTVAWQLSLLHGATFNDEGTFDAWSYGDSWGLSGGDSLQYRWDWNRDGEWDTEWSSDPAATHCWDGEWSGQVALQATDGTRAARDAP